MLDSVQDRHSVARAAIGTVAHFKGLDCKRDGESYYLFDKAGTELFSGPIDDALAYLKK